MPLVLSAIPFAMLFGALAMKVGLGLWGGVGFSSLIFAGSAQFVGADLYGQGTGLLIIFAVVFLLNARHLLYSLDLAKRCPHWPNWGRLIVGYFLTDESYAISARRLDAKPHEPLPLAYFTGSSLVLFVFWNFFTLVGLLLVAQLPNIADLGIEIAIYSAYIAIFVPMIVTFPRLAVALSAAGLSLALKDLPFQLGLVAGTFGGIAIGMLLLMFWPSNSSGDGGSRAQ